MEQNTTCSQTHVDLFLCVYVILLVHGCVTVQSTKTRMRNAKPLLAAFIIDTSFSPGIISKSGFQYGKFANNMFSILKLLVTVPKMGKIHHLSNMTFWGNFAIFETTAKNSVLERWGVTPHLQYPGYGKKIKKIRSGSFVYVFFTILFKIPHSSPFLLLCEELLLGRAAYFHFPLFSLPMFPTLLISAPTP